MVWRINLAEADQRGHVCLHRDGQRLVRLLDQRLRLIHARCCLKYLRASVPDTKVSPFADKPSYLFGGKTRPVNSSAWKNTEQESSCLPSALKSGLDAESQFVLGESREDFAQLQTEWYDYHAPVNPEERLQVDIIIRSKWFLRRFFRIEAQLWEFHPMEAQRNTGVELGEAFSKASLIFMRFQRRTLLAEKSGKEARAELDRLKALRQPQQATAETQQMGSFLATPINPGMGDLELAQLERYLAQKLAAVPIQEPGDPEL